MAERKHNFLQEVFPEEEINLDVFKDHWPLTNIICVMPLRRKLCVCGLIHTRSAHFFNFGVGLIWGPLAMIQNDLSIKSKVRANRWNWWEQYVWFVSEQIHSSHFALNVQVFLVRFPNPLAFTQNSLTSLLWPCMHSPFVFAQIVASKLDQTITLLKNKIP